MSTIFLTGATGYIGGTLARRLLANGHQVRGLVRGDDGAARAAVPGLHPVTGSLDDAELLAREARGADAVIHTASADHLPSIQALLAALEGSGKPLIHTSGASVVGDDARGQAGNGTVFDDEGMPLVVGSFKQARRDIDLAVLAAAVRGVRSAVVCPGLIYGLGAGPKRDSVQIPFLAAHARQMGHVDLVGPGLNRWSTVHLDDVVDLYCRVLDHAPAGAFYFAESGEFSFAEIGAALAQRLGLPGPQALDPELAASRWGVAMAHYSLGSNCRVRALRARRELGWQPGQASVTDWIRQQLPIDLPTSTSRS